MTHPNKKTCQCAHSGKNTKICDPVPPFSDTQWEPDAQWCPQQKFTPIKPQPVIFAEFDTTEMPPPQWVPNMVIFPGVSQTKYQSFRKMKHHDHKNKHTHCCKHSHKREKSQRREKKIKKNNVCTASCGCVTNDIVATPVTSIAPPSTNGIVTAPLTNFVDDIRGYIYTRNPFADTTNAGGYHWQ